MKVKVLLASLLLTLTACGGDGFDTSDVPEGHEIGDSIGEGIGYNGVMRKSSSNWCDHIPFQEDHRKGGEIKERTALFVMACASKAVTPISVDRKAVCDRFEHVVGGSDEFRAFYRENCGHYEFPGDMTGDGNDEGAFYRRFINVMNYGGTILLYNASGEEEDVFGYHKWKAEKDRLDAEKERQWEQEKIEDAIERLEFAMKTMATDWNTHSTYERYCKPLNYPEIESHCQRAKELVDIYKAEKERKRLEELGMTAVEEVEDNLRETLGFVERTGGKLGQLDREYTEEQCAKYTELTGGRSEYCDLILNR